MEIIKFEFIRLFRRFRGYVKRYKIIEILPHESKYLNIKELLTKKMPIKIKNTQGDTPVIPFKSNKHLDYKLIVTLNYETDTGYPTPKEIKEDLIFECDKKGCEEIKIETKVEEL